MTQPSEAYHHTLGRGGEVGPDPVDDRRRIDGRWRKTSRWRNALRWLIVVAFACRAVLAVLEAESVASDGMRSLPLVSAVSFGSSSLVWPVLWGVLALAAAVALALGVRAGWLLAVAVTIVYLVVGISDVSTLADTFGQDLGSTLGTIAVGLGVPLAILAGLASVREWYIPSGRAAPDAHRPPQATPPALYRWRRRR